MANPQRSEIVSNEAELLILVDSQDRELGHLDKAACHNDSGVLHRAFSLFIFNSQGQLLLNNAPPTKGCGAATGRIPAARTHARLKLCSSRVEAVSKNWGSAPQCNSFMFEYQAEYADKGSEHELCSALLGSSTAHPMSTPPKSAPTAGLTLRNLIASSVTQTASSHLGCVWSGKR